MLTRLGRKRLENQKKDQCFDFVTNANISTNQRSTSDGGEGSKEQKPKLTMSIGTVNIRDGRGGNLEMACNRLQRLEFDLVILRVVTVSSALTVKLS